MLFSKHNVFIVDLRFGIYLEEKLHSETFFFFQFFSFSNFFLCYPVSSIKSPMCAEGGWGVLINIGLKRS